MCVYVCVSFLVGLGRLVSHLYKKTHTHTRITITHKHQRPRPVLACLHARCFPPPPPSISLTHNHITSHHAHTPNWHHTPLIITCDRLWQTREVLHQCLINPQLSVRQALADTDSYLDTQVRGRLGGAAVCLFCLSACLFACLLSHARHPPHQPITTSTTTPPPTYPTLTRPKNNVTTTPTKQ